MTEQPVQEDDPILQDLQERAEDLRAKLAAEKPFVVPTDDFRRACAELALAATRDAIETRKQELSNA